MWCDREGGVEQRVPHSKVIAVFCLVICLVLSSVLSCLLPCLGFCLVFCLVFCLLLFSVLSCLLPCRGFCLVVSSVLLLACVGLSTNINQFIFQNVGKCVALRRDKNEMHLRATGRKQLRSMGR